MSKKKDYSDSWSKSDLSVELTKQYGHGAEKEVREAVLGLARKQLAAACEKYGPQAKKDAVQNLKTSLTLFGPRGKFWIQGEEESDVYTDDGAELAGTAYCAIGAISKANGQAEHLARLAADLAAGELFPKRAMTNLEEVDMYEVGESINVGLPDVVEFNDNDDTTFPEVKAVFKRAVEILS